MYITKVELQDIKSYTTASFEFQRGTTAIIGSNGAGKTTIIEAIAWALFNFLDYNADDFVRRGAKRGTVRVSFESGFDKKIYTVIRNTSGKHQVFDTETKTVIAEQNASVVTFLRNHLQVEPGTNLKELFRAAIGVPQGTFTADFLQSADKRKAIFDRLLKVEEYRQGSEKLRETSNLVREKRGAIETRLAVANREIETLVPREAEFADITIQISKLETDLQSLIDEITLRKTTLETFETARIKLESTQNRLNETRTNLQNSVVRESIKQSEVVAARTAREKLVAVKPDYDAFLIAETELKNLENQRIERDKIQTQSNKLRESLIKAEAQKISAQDNLKRAIDAGKELIALAPKIIEQEKLENDYNTLLKRRADSESARRNAEDLGREVAAKRAEYQTLNSSIKDAEKGANSAKRVTELESEINNLQSKLDEANKAATSLSLLEPRLQILEKDGATLQKNLSNAETEVETLKSFANLAAKVPELNETENALKQKIADLQAAIALDAKFNGEVKNGLCPILSQKCLNLREGETLETYFTGKSNLNANDLQTCKSEQIKVALELKQARDAERQTVRLENLNRQITDWREKSVEMKDELQSVKSKINDLSNFTPQMPEELRATKSKIEVEIKTEREWATKFAALEGLRNQLQTLKDEGVKLAEKQKGFAEIAAQLVDIEGETTINQNTLRDLNNPKGRAVNCRQESSREPDLNLQIGEINATIKTFESENEILEQNLSKFASLDEKLNSVNVELNRTRTARDEFLRNQTFAEKLPILEIEFEKIAVEVKNLQAETVKFEAEHDDATRNYNGEKHFDEKALMQTAQNDESAKRAVLNQKKEREVQLSADLIRLNELRESIRDDAQEQEKLAKVAETTDYIRETLKNAAPFVGEMMRFRITKEANELFREITGENARTLKWSKDYEIQLEEGGRERPFANLSGGEQMAAAISVRLALLMQLSEIRLAFFDEPTTNLDSERRERLADQLGQIRRFEQLFVISHDDTFHEKTDNEINLNALKNAETNVQLELT